MQLHIAPEDMNATKNSLCPCCSEGTLENLSRDYLAKIGEGQTIKVPNVQMEVCGQCGEEILSLEAARAVYTAIEKYLPPKRMAAQARREKSIQHGHPVEIKTLLDAARRQLHAVMQDETLMAETPVEVQAAIASAAQAIGAAWGRLESIAPQPPPSAPPPGGPTRQQGQFLAFIREYIMRNEAGVAPSHADFQRFFNLTPPSVNSMLVRLEQRGFIRRIPGKARAIEIVCPPDCIPPPDRPFKF